MAGSGGQEVKSKKCTGLNSRPYLIAQKNHVLIKKHKQMNLKDKNVLVTGGSLGIGLELANRLVAEGANVLICARNLPALEKAKEENPSLEIVTCDVTDPEQVEYLQATIKQRFGGIDILLNNAAVFRRFDILKDYSLDKQLEEVEINFHGPIILTNMFLEELRKRKESMIVNFTSPAAYMPMAASIVYSATKAAIRSWTISLRHQLKNTNIKVVEINPPAVDTRMNANNPGVEGMKLMSTNTFADLAIKGLKQGKEEILIGQARPFKSLSRFLPKMAFKMVNKA